MSDELDRRAALAMGIKRHEDYFGEYWESADGKYCEKEPPHPSADRNDLAELLREVERRGLALDMVDKAVDAWMKNDTHDNTDMCMFWFLVSDPAIICEAACEVLEAANEQK